MSAIKYAAAAALAAAIEAKVPALANRVAVVDTPPTTASEYPSGAVLVDRFTFEAMTDEELDDEAGDPIMSGHDALVEAGALRGSMRIWLAGRLPAQREDLEERVLRMFAGDELAVGRLLVPLPNVRVGDFASGLTWHLAFFVEETEWRDELVFSERHWAYLTVEVDLPVLVLREHVPVVQQLLILATGDLSVTVDSPDDVAQLPGLEEHPVT